MSKIGLIFGSYNPPHKGHAYLADYALKHNSLDEIWFMLQAYNPYKEMPGNIDVHTRLEMLRILASASDKYKTHVTNTVNLPSALDALKKTFSHEYWLIMGSDLVSTLPTWTDYNYLKTYNIIPVKRIKNISSEDIRSDIKSHKPVAELVEPAIEHYIIQNHLYQK
jgi:nicotinate-nucleotide adenylyltransferase